MGLHKVGNGRVRYSRWASGVNLCPNLRASGALREAPGVGKAKNPQLGAEDSFWICGELVGQVCYAVPAAFSASVVGAVGGFDLDSAEVQFDVQIGGRLVSCGARAASDGVE